MNALKAVDALRAAGCEVVGMLAIFTYGFPVAEEAFAKANVSLTTLSCYNDMIDVAAQMGYVTNDDITTLKEWRKDPANWKK